jgi:hypothetical protein
MKLLPGSFNKVLLLQPYRVNSGLYIGQGDYFLDRSGYLQLFVCCFRVACVYRGRVASIH